jgi:hypothetical protein
MAGCVGGWAVLEQIVCGRLYLGNRVAGDLLGTLHGILGAVFQLEPALGYLLARFGAAAGCEQCGSGRAGHRAKHQPG